ncbi:iron reductase [Cristinia sonorae]|uniref:ferric-chelate reductase (NADPH) n=1 Tax=Cristinia sonorae TaxID=1940300 RepID=A0A8K0XJZ9_9AGAR|nr:iron reductase [Cristinia sonorae]
MSAILAAVASASSTPTPSKAVKFNHLNLIFNVDVFILCLVGLFILLCLPRAFVRFIHPEEWRNGHWLRYVDVHNPLRTHSAPAIAPLSPAHLPISPKSSDPFNDSHSEKSHYFDDHRGANLQRNASSSSGHALLSRNASTASGRIRKRRDNLPAHMPSWSTMVPWIPNLFRFTIRPGLTVTKVILMLTYFFILLYATLYKSNVFTSPIRAGFVAASQIPVVVVLGTKNNLLAVAVGMGYEKLNFLHRFAGRMLVLAANVHALGYIYSWSIAGTLDARFAIPNIRYGMVGLVCADIFVFFSTSLWRTKCYQVFVVSHVTAIVIFLAAVCLHSTPSIPYVLIAIGLYVFDRIFRIAKTRATTAHLTALTELGMTRVELPGVNAGWRAGQHVRIRVLNRAMGITGWLELHPFTIANVAKSDDGEGMVLLVKKAGNWTNRLFELAKRVEYSEASGVEKDVKVLVEGPYGGPGHTLFASFSGAMFVAGGSGVTFALGAVQDLVKKDLEGLSRVRTIELVWSVPDPSNLIPLIPQFTHLLSLRTYATLRIHVFYTRVSCADPMKALASHTLPKGLTITPGRPKLNSLLTSVIDESCALSMFRKNQRKSYIDGRDGKSGRGLCGIIVGVCGPLGLAEEVRNTVRGVDAKRRRRVGGVEVHEEVFGW